MHKSIVSQLASIFGGVAVAVASVVSPLVLADDHGPKVYGRIDVGVQNEDRDQGASTDDDTWSVKSFSSRLGVKGEEKLSDAISVVYQYEIQIEPEDEEINDSNDSLSVTKDGSGFVTDVSSKGSFLKGRNQFVGLKGGFGLIRLGRIDTPLKKAQGKVDLFADHIGELDGVFNKEGDNRLGDQINYTTPKMGDAVKVQVALLQGENQNDIDGSGDSGANDDGLGDGVSANVIYKKDDLFFAAAVDSDVKGKDAWRIAGQVKLDALKLGALYQVAEDNTANPDERAGFILSAAYDVGPVVLLGQYGDTELEDSSGATLEERSEFTVGVHKNYSKTTTVYAELSDYTVEKPGVVDDETFTVVAGIRKKF